MANLLTFSQLRKINMQRARRWHGGFPAGDDFPERLHR